MMGKLYSLLLYGFQFQLLLGTVFVLFHFSTAALHMPAIVKIGAMLPLNSTMGSVAKNAVELAVQGINSDSTLLSGTRLVAEIVDGDNIMEVAATAREFLNGVCAVVRSQSCIYSFFQDNMVFDSQVPILSFNVTGITFSRLQNHHFCHTPYFDSMHMAAIAALIDYHGWTKVTVLYREDEYGQNGIAMLENALSFMKTILLQKTALPSGIDKDAIADILTHLAKLEFKVLVVHSNHDMGLMILKVAYHIGMINSDYVWIVTDSLAAALDSKSVDLDSLSSSQGIIAVKRHFPELPWLRDFLAEGNLLQKEGISMSSLNSFASYAYDAVWMVACAIDSYLRQNQRIEFKGLLLTKAGNTSELMHILHSKFNGTIDAKLGWKGGLTGSVFEFLEMAVNEVRVFGYWTNETGILTSPNLDLAGTSCSLKPTSPKPFFQHEVWPEGSNQLFQGRKLHESPKLLKIGIPKKTGFKNFVNWSEKSGAHGFCIEVYNDALQYIPYNVDTEFYPFGNGNTTPIYDDMVDRLANKEFDALVGDFTLLASRMDKIDFTQPYIESGIGVLAPVKNDNSRNEWAFLRPFTPAMWFTTGAFFVFTGVVLWVLEHKKNPDFQGRPKKQIVTILWSIFSTLFFSQRESIRSTLGRFVTIIWLFVVLIINSSYTANLTSLLTVQKLSPTIQGLNALRRSKQTVGYQEGSFVKKYLLSLNFPEERLHPLNSVSEYKRALELGADNPGGVAAIVDEIPYLKVFLRHECGFMIGDQQIIRGGWGFGFQKGSESTRDFSKAILRLYENGELQKLQDTWLNGDQCNDDIQSSQLGLKSFEGLFLLTGLASSACLVIYIVRLLRYFTPRFKNSNPYDKEENLLSSHGVKFVKSFASYINETGADYTDDQCQRKRKRDGRIVPYSDSITSSTTDVSRQQQHDGASVE